MTSVPVSKQSQTGINSNTFADIVSHVSSTIVNIETKVTIETNPAMAFGPFMFQEPRRVERKALGSGVIVTSRGFIVTNDHVIEKADHIKIITADEHVYDGDVVVRDTLHDLAIIRIVFENEDLEDYDDEEDEDEFELDDEADDATENPNKKKKTYRDRNNQRMKSKNEVLPVNGRRFPCIEFGGAEYCQVGDLVLAIGNNLGFHGTVTDGIISAIGRTNDDRLPIAYPQFPLIQTNAAINPGSSGGALVNMNGELVGVNESIATSTGGNVGVGFAVPVNFVKPLLRAAINSGLDIERVWDGISPLSMPMSAAIDTLEKPSSGQSVKYGRAYPRGICVKSIHKKSPAFKAGLKRGDVIVQMNDIAIDNVNTYYLMIAGTEPDEILRYHVIRDTSMQRKWRKRKRGARSQRRNSKNQSQSQSKGDSSSPNKQGFYDISWLEFESYKELDINVPIELIPAPTQKPIEIKDRINPFYGAEIVELCPAINSDFGLDFNQTGVAIWDLERDSQADKLNFRIGDILLYVDTFRIRKLDDVLTIGERMQMRKNCRIKFKRNGKTNHVDVYLRTTRRRHFSRL